MKSKAAGNAIGRHATMTSERADAIGRTVPSRHGEIKESQSYWSAAKAHPWSLPDPLQNVLLPLLTRAIIDSLINRSSIADSRNECVIGVIACWCYRAFKLLF